MSNTAPVEYAVEFLRANVEEWCWQVRNPTVSEGGKSLRITIHAERGGAAIADLAQEGHFVAVALARDARKRAPVWFLRRFDSRKAGWDRRFRDWTWPTLVGLVTKRSVRAR